MAYQLLSFKQIYNAFVVQLFKDECGKKICDNLIRAFDIECIKIASSSVLSYVILIGGLVVKIPQITNILRQGNANGLSIFTLLLEISSLCISGAYNYRKGHPFESYGESVFLLAQTSIIVLLVIQFGTDVSTAKKTLPTSDFSQKATNDPINEIPNYLPKNTDDVKISNGKTAISSGQNGKDATIPKKSNQLDADHPSTMQKDVGKNTILRNPLYQSSFFIALLTALYHFLVNLATESELEMLVNFWALPLFILSRVNQIFKIFKDKSVGTLSLASNFLISCGSVARVYTTTKVNDPSLLLSTSVAALLNCAILAQIWFYS